MPRTKEKAVARKNIRLPKPMVDEVDRIVRAYPELYNNRQQFIEAAIREGIEKLHLLETAKSERLVSRAQRGE